MKVRRTLKGNFKITLSQEEAQRLFNIINISGRLLEKHASKSGHSYGTSETDEGVAMEIWKGMHDLGFFADYSGD